MASAHTSMSPAVYASTTGFPVVPEEVWISTISLRSTESSP